MAARRTMRLATSALLGLAVAAYLASEAAAFEASTQALQSSNCDIAHVPSGSMQQVTNVDAPTATVSCDPRFATHGDVAEVTYECMKGNWEPVDPSLTYLNVLCAADCPKNPSFTSMHGDCASYSLETGINFNYCTVDTDNSNPSKFAYQVCPECGFCFATPTPTPTLTPENKEGPLPSRVPSAVKTHGHCYCYEDSVNDCTTQGTCEVHVTEDCTAHQHTPDTSQTHSQRSHGTVHWDTCPLVGENMCVDKRDWTDKDGWGCLDYATTACRYRSVKSGMDVVGKDEIHTDNFAHYADESNHDATHSCCMCGGGTQRCFNEYLDSQYKNPLSPLLYDFSNCEGITIGDTCEGQCAFKAETAANFTCKRDHVDGYDERKPGETQASVDPGSLSCHAFHQNYVLLNMTTDSDSVTSLTTCNLHNDEAPGWEHKEELESSWVDCVKYASKVCASGLTWTPDPSGGVGKCRRWGWACQFEGDTWNSDINECSHGGTAHRVCREDNLKAIINPEPPSYSFQFIGFAFSDRKFRVGVPPEVVSVTVRKLSETDYIFTIMVHDEYNCRSDVYSIEKPTHLGVEAEDCTGFVVCNQEIPIDFPIRANGQRMRLRSTKIQTGSKIHAYYRTGDEPKYAVSEPYTLP